MHAFFRIFKPCDRCTKKNDGTRGDGAEGFGDF